MLFLTPPPYTHTRAHIGLIKAESEEKIVSIPLFSHDVCLQKYMNFFVS